MSLLMLAGLVLEVLLLSLVLMLAGLVLEVLVLVLLPSMPAAAMEALPAAERISALRVVLVANI
jgi:hypothetical protein